MDRRFLAISILFVVLTGGCEKLGQRRGMECLAPANAGGGWDLTCRAFSASLNEIGTDSSFMRVTNLPGAGGGIAFANVVSQRFEDPNLVVAASPATTLRLAQGQFGNFTESDVRWLGAIAADYGVLAVKADSPLRNLAALVEAWREDPDAVVVSGGSAVGGQDHMKVLLLAREAAIDIRRIRYVPFDGGGEAMTALLGGFVQVSASDASEILGQLQAGTIRVLAVLAKERMEPPLHEIPTATELGFPVDWVVWRGFYGPPEISDETYAGWLETLREVATSEAWFEKCRRLGLRPFFMSGNEFRTFVSEQVRTFRELSLNLGLIQ